jgi:hypothetical protein
MLLTTQKHTNRWCYKNFKKRAEYNIKINFFNRLRRLKMLSSIKSIFVLIIITDGFWKAIH